MNMALSNNVDSDSGVGVGNILATLTPTPTLPKLSTPTYSDLDSATAWL